MIPMRDAGRPHSRRPRLGGRRRPARIAALLERPGPWTVPRPHRYRRRPPISGRTLYRRVRQVAAWRRPKLVAHGDPARAVVVARLVKRPRLLPQATVVWTADGTHVHLLPRLRSNWTTFARRPQIATPGRNLRLTALGALEVPTGVFRYRLGRRRAADFLTASSNGARRSRLGREEGVRSARWPDPTRSGTARGAGVCMANGCEPSAFPEVVPVTGREPGSANSRSTSPYLALRWAQLNATAEQAVRDGKSHIPRSLSGVCLSRISTAFGWVHGLESATRPHDTVTRCCPGLLMERTPIGTPSAVPVPPVRSTGRPWTRSLVDVLPGGLTTVWHGDVC